MTNRSFVWTVFMCFSINCNLATKIEHKGYLHFKGCFIASLAWIINSVRKSTTQFFRHLTFSWKMEQYPLHKWFLCACVLVSYLKRENVKVFHSSLPHSGKMALQREKLKIVFHGGDTFIHQQYPICRFPFAMCCDLD